MAENKNLFVRLTKLFRSGPIIKRRVKNYNAKLGGTSTALEVFKRAHSDVYNSTLSSYGAFDRMSRYSDFSEMESTPEISAALDIYAEECVSPDANGRALHIYSENRKIQEILDDLFYETLNVEFNLGMWVRNLVKYGDFFLFNDVSPEFGIMNVFPISISEIEREEGFDPADPMAVRYRWITQGNKILENWQISHFRLLGNDAFLPYGSSVLEPARRIWRQLILLEDAMLVYRIVRAPERRVFKVDVGNVPPEDIANYMEQVQSSLKKAPVVDKNNGRVDLRYNPLSVDEDYYIPVRGSDSGTSIETLGGGTMAGETNDVEYIQKKLFAALKIPKAYLGYDEGLGAKATLSQEDIRFSRTIARIQRTVLAELNKVAVIHLYCNGFSNEELLDFTLRLSNPSTIAQQQKLELFKSRFEAAGTALTTPGLVDRRWVQKNILRLTNEEIEAIANGLTSDKVQDLEIEATTVGGEEAGPVGGGLGGMGGGPAPTIDLGGGGPPGLSEKNIVSMEDEDAPIKILDNIAKISDDLLSEEKVEENDDSELTEFEKFQKEAQKEFKTKNKKARKNHLFADNHFSSYQRKREQNHVSGMPREMSNLKQASKMSEDFEISEYLDMKIEQNGFMTDRLKGTLQKMDNILSISKKVISESKESTEEEDKDEAQ